MTFDQFVDQAWNDHGTESEAVAERLRNFELTAEEQIPQLASIITHVFGEHLGRWQEGISLLERLQMQADSAENRNTLYRSITALKLAAGMGDQVDDLLTSDQIRVLCMVASALSGQKQTERAAAHFDEALQLASPGLPEGDPALRALAVTGNNLAIELEKLGARSPRETEFMVSAARAGLKYWQIAGQWSQHQIAHFRLSKCLLAAGQSTEALEEAMSCLAMCKTHGALARDLFWANEAVASVVRQSKPSVFPEYLDRMRTEFAALSEADQLVCQPRLKELEASLVTLN